MSRQSKRALTLALTIASLAPIALAPSCAENDDGAAPNETPDAATPSDAASDASDAATDPDAAPTGCVGEWCVVPLDGLSNVAVNAIWGSGPTDVWAVGTRGFAAHFDGTKWEVRRPNTLLALFAVWGSGPTDVWAVNAGNTVFHWNGSAWEERQIGQNAEGPDETRPILALSGSGPENILALVEPKSDVFVECPSIWGGTTMVSCPDVYRFSRVEGTLAWRKAFDESVICNTLYTEGFYCTGLSGLWTAPEGDPWLVGESGKAIRPRAGGTLPEFAGALDETHSLVTLESVGGSSSKDVWTVGASGTIRHFTGGTEWVRTEVPTNAHLRNVYAPSATEAWAVGDDGAVVRWNGTTWSLEKTPLDARPRPLYAAWGAPNGDTFVGGEHVILRRSAGSKP